MIRSFESALASNGAALHLVAGALLTECSIVTAMLRWTCRHTCRVAEGKSAPSMAAMQLLDVSLKTAAVPGGTAAAVRLLEGIAAAGGVAAYLNACLAVTLSYGSADARQQGLAWLTGLQLDDAPLPALTEAISSRYASSCSAWRTTAHSIRDGIKMLHGDSGGVVHLSVGHRHVQSAIVVSCWPR